MNIQHSSRSDEWYTPVNVLDRVRQVLTRIDLDPASTEKANAAVGAKRFYTRHDDGLKQTWSGSMFINPPGGKRGNRSMTGLFWEKLLSELERGLIEHAIFLCFSVEALQSTQRYQKSVGDFPFCVPSKRIAFVPGFAGVATQPSHSNAIVYVPGTEDETELFESVFSTLGKVIVPA